MHNYRLYDQRIVSDIPIRALNELDSPWTDYDLRVRLGTTPQQLHQAPVVQRVCTTMAENEFLFHHPRLGVRFYVKDGNEVIVDRNYYDNPEAVSVYFLGSIMGAVLYMRNVIPMHASAVLTDQGAVLFTGASGVGKSTLAHGLQQRGYRPITDDVAPIQVRNGDLHVIPGYSKFKIWQDVLQLSHLSQEDAPRIRDSFNKYYVDFTQEPQPGPYPIHKIYHLNLHNDDALLTLIKTDSEDRFKIVQRNMYRPAYAQGLGRQSQHFHVTVALAHLPMTTITRPQRVEDFEAYLDRIEEDLRA